LSATPLFRQSPFSANQKEVKKQPKIPQLQVPFLANQEEVKKQPKIPPIPQLQVPFSANPEEAKKQMRALLNSCVAKARQLAPVVGLRAKG
jgi:hypothetical protein